MFSRRPCNKQDAPEVCNGDVRVMMVVVVVVAATAVVVVLLVAAAALVVVAVMVMTGRQWPCQ